VAVFGFLGYYLIGCKPKFVDFLIATEGEMKKVNWSTRREILGSTWVVIGLTVVIALIISVLDFLIYSPLFRTINVLESTG
jgi:preprotein translocase SecE subunit